ncbi:hypothetical protein [Endozoicomonas sp. 8E]|uniref:hypothetical protein n=1 Tax=Endozoicomonas sp. 8E TaxID=3035692 RepID=UPI002939114A|nr:hypothetical protein [Endozoicomonas sp. 8E]WOG28175.1 hypothetical protein P6910_00550 [Endozoicomonas sp. 8E]
MDGDSERVKRVKGMILIPLLARYNTDDYTAGLLKARAAIQSRLCILAVRDC